MSRTHTLPILDSIIARYAAFARRRERRHARPFILGELTPQLLADIGLSPNGELVADEAPRSAAGRCEA